MHIVEKEFCRKGLSHGNHVSWLLTFNSTTGELAVKEHRTTASGSVRFKVEMKLGRRGNTANPYHSTIGKHVVFHVETVLGLLLHSDGVKCEWEDVSTGATLPNSAV